jgi:hypothetical protein
MSGTIKQFRSTRPARRNRNEGPVFVAAILVLAVVAVVLYLGNGLGIIPTVSAVDVASKTNGRPVALRQPTQMSIPAVRVLLPTSVVRADTFQPALEVARTRSVATPTPPPAIVTPRSATPIALLIGHVGNTGGDPDYLRRSPHLADRWLVWAANTTLVLFGNEAAGDGQRWLKVRDPIDLVGWIPAQYITS